MHFVVRRSVYSPTLERYNIQINFFNLPSVGSWDIRADDVENILFAKCKRLVIFVIDAILLVSEFMVDC